MAFEEKAGLRSLKGVTVTIQGNELNERPKEIVLKTPVQKGIIFKIEDGVLQAETRIR